MVPGRIRYFARLYIHGPGADLPCLLRQAQLLFPLLHIERRFLSFVDVDGSADPAKYLSVFVLYGLNTGRKPRVGIVSSVLEPIFDFVCVTVLRRLLPSSGNSWPVFGMY